MPKPDANGRRLTPIEDLAVAKSPEELRGILWARVEQHLRPDKPAAPAAAERTSEK